MADHDFPAGLIDAQRGFYAADADVERLYASLPSSIAIAAGEASISDEQRDELAAAIAERGRHLERLYSDPWWETVAVEDRLPARSELQKRARIG